VILKVNRKRKAREFARTYESVERVEFVKALPSVWDGAGPCVNAHVGRKGAGARRKADADQIVPLTDWQHRAFDEHRAPFDTEAAREAVRACCADVEARWLAFSGGDA
jgi:aminoglycoside phosphotransferase family enzyme